MQREDDLGTGLALDPHEVGVEPEAAVTGCSQTKDTGVCGGQWALWGTQSRGYLQTCPGRPAQDFSSIPHRSPLGGFVWADASGCAQLAERERT